jgi:hypothetical protein
LLADFAFQLGNPLLGVRNRWPRRLVRPVVRSAELAAEGRPARRRLSEPPAAYCSRQQSSSRRSTPSSSAKPTMLGVSAMRASADSLKSRVKLRRFFRSDTLVLLTEQCA